jgi:hypothetical protein
MIMVENFVVSCYEEWKAAEAERYKACEKKNLLTWRGIQNQLKAATNDSPTRLV